MTHFILGLAGIAGILGFLKSLVFFIITIFVLVTIHEFGHFIAGRIFGMHVPIFSVGMGRRLFGFNKLNGFTVGPLHADVEEKLGANTDYRLSLLPIGGYAKIDGMIDETQSEELSADVKPWEFRAKPWWQKSIVISAGVIMNVLLAWFIFSARDYAMGEDLHMTTTVGYVTSTSISKQIGIQPGDKVLRVNNHSVVNWEDVNKALMLDNLGHDFPVVIERNGQQMTFVYRNAQLGAADDLDHRADLIGLTPSGFGAPTAVEVGPTDLGVTPAKNAGIRVGDIITHINGDSIVNSSALIDHIFNSPNKAMDVHWLRSGIPMSAVVTPDKQGKIGIRPSDPQYSGPKKHIDYTLAQAPGIGWADLVNNVKLTGKMIGLMMTGQVSASKAFGGPIKIAQLATQSANNGFDAFVGFIALLSMSLAMLNILPIPALDGGHLIIILIEAAIGRELSQKFKMGFQKVGVALLLCLMVFMVINDIRGVL